MHRTNPSNLTMYQHPNVARMEHSGNMNPAHNNYIQNMTMQQQYTNISQLPLRKEVDEQGRACALVQPKNNVHPSAEEEDEMDPQTTEMADDHLPGPKQEPTDGLGLLQDSLEGIQNKLEGEINEFMETAHPLFLKISSKELKIQEAAALLGRPYSFVYSRYQEFCDTITGKATINKKKKKGTKLKELRKKKRKQKRLTIAKKSGKAFQCEDCPATFLTNASLKGHSKCHLEDNESHVCTTCGIVYNRLRQLMKHRIDIHEDALQCPHCDRQYTIITSYQQHIRTAHAKVRPFICELCGKGFFSRAKHEEHMHVHTGYKPFMCGYCEKCFVSLTNLNNHHKLVHENAGEKKEKNFICQECGKGFTTNWHCQEHAKIHTGIKPFACDMCPKRFLQKCNLNTHQKWHRGIKQVKKKGYVSPKNIPCKECGRMYSTNYKLRLHMNTHTGERPFACDQCDYRCARKEPLKRHKLTAHSTLKPYKCTICPAAYATKADLKRHHIAHTGGINYKKFKCDLCDYTCVKKWSLEHHVNSTHTGKTPFKCDVYGCNNEYSNSNSLYQHKLKHLPPAPKTCTVCQEKFPDGNSLGRHMMIHPGHEPIACTQCDKIFYTQNSLNRHVSVHMFKAGAKPKQTKPRNKNPVKRASKSQKKLSAQYEGAGVAATENGHNSASQSWAINGESLNNSQHSFHHPAFPTSQFTNLNGWPATMDPDELRHRLLSSFK